MHDTCNRNSLEKKNIRKPKNMKDSGSKTMEELALDRRKSMTKNMTVFFKYIVDFEQKYSSCV